MLDGLSTVDSPLDDFIQRTGTDSIPELTRNILAFFEQADAMNRVSVRRAFRDTLAKALYPLLGLLWPFAYVCVFTLIAHLILTLVGTPVAISTLHQQAVVAVLCAGAGFFLTHAFHVTFRNIAFAVCVVRRIPPCGFFLPPLGLVAASTAIIWSCGLLGCAWQLPIWIASSAVLHALYLSCRRIRAELASISRIQSLLDANGPHSGELLDIGSVRVSTSAFPVFAHESRDVFISYMHRSVWSVLTASRIHEQLKEAGHPVFFDRTTIEPGGPWRTSLMRGLSECGLFIAVLDDDEAAATAWVLSESIYAATLRKTIGKPRILLVIRGPSGTERLARGRFGRVYRDLFTRPEAQRPGTRIVVAPPTGLPQGELLEAIASLRPISIVP